MAFNLKIQREKPFQHRGRYGTNLLSNRCDLMGSIVVHKPKNIGLNEFAKDMTEIIGWWTANIYPDMSQDGQGFRGFDCLNIEVVEIDEEDEDPTGA